MRIAVDDHRNLVERGAGPPSMAIGSDSAPVPLALERGPAGRQVVLPTPPPVAPNPSIGADASLRHGSSAANQTTVSAFCTEARGSGLSLVKEDNPGARPGVLTHPGCPAQLATPSPNDVPTRATHNLGPF